MSRPTTLVLCTLLLLMPIVAGCAAVDPTVTPVVQRPADAGGSIGQVGPEITHVLKPTPEPQATEPPATRPPSIEASYWLDKEVNHGSNAFGLALLRMLFDPEAPENVMISPVSLEMALGMTASGAVGDTQAGMLEALSLADVGMERANEGMAALMQTYADPALPATVAIANALWLAEGTPFHDAYLQDTARYYDAELTTLPMDDVAVERINTWVNEKTLGEIPTIVSPPLSEDTALLLTNAIYFKGKWRDPFDPERTVERPFKLLDGTEIQVPTMSRTDKLPLYQVLAEDGSSYRVTALPYGDDGDLQMWLILPDYDNGLAGVLNHISADEFPRWNASFQESALQEVYLAVPKFESDYEVTLNDALAEMGMDQAFTGAADFSAMSPEGQRFFISLVKHKSAVTVDEEGTVAAAATVVQVEKSSVIQREPFVCDHPFAYVIWDGRAETALFMGVLVEP